MTKQRLSWLRATLALTPPGARTETPAPVDPKAAVAPDAQPPESPRQEDPR